MIPATVIEYLKELISKQLNTSIGSPDLVSVGGGSINDTYCVMVNDGIKLFLKLNEDKTFPGLFEKEKAGLEFLAKQQCIQTPAVISCTTIDKYQLLLLEWIEAGVRNESFWTKFGEQLARLHRVTSPDFGFDEDNYMGALTQENRYTKDWVKFFTDHRLRPQMELALANKLLQKSHADIFESVFRQLHSIFDHEQPALLHGDLWSGNFICSEKSLPVLIDPAVYFGHRSMDLAMTTLFGRFDQTFYNSYHYHYPLPVNYQEQWDICNLYPLLIHLNLFGTGYLPEISGILKKYH